MTALRIFAVSLVLLSSIAATVGAQTLDPNFWVTNGTVRAIARDPDGRIYAGGDFTYVGPPTGAAVPIHALTGSVFGTFPKIAGEVYAVMPDGHGGWYVGGRFTSVGGLARNNVAHIAANGSVGAWNPNVTGPNSKVLALSRLGSTIYIGGFFSGAAAKQGTVSPPSTR